MSHNIGNLDRALRAVLGLGLLSLLVLLALAGCSANRSEVRQLAAPMTRPPVDVPTPQATGAIYRPDLQQRTLFDDRRARRLGDTLTIVLQERVTSSKQAAKRFTCRLGRSVRRWVNWGSPHRFSSACVRHGKLRGRPRPPWKRRRP